MKKLNQLQSLLILVTLLAVLGGCTPQRKPLPPGPIPPDRVPRMQVKPTPPKTAAPTEDMASTLTRRAVEVQGVKRAYPVVLGNTAIIGLETGKTGGNTAPKVARKVTSDSRIVRAYVTEEPKLTSRIRSVADNLKRGRPMTDYLGELDSITKQISPTNR